MPKRKMTNSDVLLKLRMVGAHNFAQNASGHFTYYDFRVIDIYDGSVFVVFTASRNQSRMRKPNKDMLYAALGSHGNTAARYQIVTKEVLDAYRNGEYRVDTDVWRAVAQSRIEDKRKRQLIRAERKERNAKNKQK